MIVVAQGNRNEVILKILIGIVRLDSSKVLRYQISCNGEGFGTWGECMQVGMLTVDPSAESVEEVGNLGLS